MINDFPKFKNVGAMDRAIYKAIKEGHSHFRLLLTDGTEDEFIIAQYEYEQVNLSAEDKHDYGYIDCLDIQSFLVLD